jgi:TctA family transporter
MEVITSLAAGFASLTPLMLFYCFLGVLLGTFIGVLPGIGPLATISMLLPLTFHLEPATAIIMLAGIYYGSQYGGSTAAILLNLPGTAGSAVSCLDGYPMSKNGRAGPALFITTIASFAGGCFAILAMMLFAPPLGRVALSLGSAEYFSMMLLGLTAAVALVDGAPLKGLAMVVMGLLVGLMGTDVMSGTIRFAFGVPYLYDGVSLVIIAMGLFGVSEVVISIGSDAANRLAGQKITLRSLAPSREEVRRSRMPVARGAVIGTIVGIVPGAGSTVAAFLSYAVEKRMARDPSRMGKGAVEGIAGPESANNASSQAEFIPTLTLGIPGGATMALILGALMIHGIAPGPQLIVRHPEIFWGLIASFWIGNVLLLILNIPLIGVWVAILKIRYHLLYPAILIFICLGVYSVNNSTVDIILLLVCGGGGYFLVVLKFGPALLLLGYVLGPMMEENFRRSMLISGGDLTVFVTRPVSGMLLAISAGLIAFAIVGSVRRRRQSVVDAAHSSAAARSEMV